MHNILGQGKIAKKISPEIKKISNRFCYLYVCMFDVSCTYIYFIYNSYFFILKISRYLHRTENHVKLLGIEQQQASTNAMYANDFVRYHTCDSRLPLVVAPSNLD